jgi:hypothetical protein
MLFGTNYNRCLCHMSTYLYYWCLCSKFMIFKPLQTALLHRPAWSWNVRTDTCFRNFISAVPLDLLLLCWGLVVFLSCFSFSVFYLLCCIVFFFNLEFVTKISHICMTPYTHSVSYYYLLGLYIPLWKPVGYFHFLRACFQILSCNMWFNCEQLSVACFPIYQ